jgi:CheY-like chemotaxis protein
VVPEEPKGIRILLVDDNLDHTQIALRALRADARVEAARLGGEALDRAADERFDLVLLDYRLPDMSGLDVLARLKERADAPAVILMSAQGSEEVAMQALKAGAAGYVVKNADFGKRLVYEVREWIAEHGKA